MTVVRARAGHWLQVVRTDGSTTRLPAPSALFGVGRAGLEQPRSRIEAQRQSAAMALTTH